MVRIDKLPPGVRVYSVPATRLAEELGKRMVLNIVMVGFFGAVTNIVDTDELRKAVEDSVPPALQKLNLAAFDKGFAYASGGDVYFDGSLVKSYTPACEISALNA